MIRPIALHAAAAMLVGLATAGGCAHQDQTVSLRRQLQDANDALRKAEQDNLALDRRIAEQQEHIDRLQSLGGRRIKHLFRVERIRLGRYTGGADLDDKPEFLQRRGSRRFTREDTSLIRRCIAYYYAMMSQIDDMIGRIGEALEKNGQAENTILILTSDHGDMLGDFGMMGKSNFFEWVIRVPTMVVLPPRFGQVSRRFDGLAETISLAATALDYAGVERPPEMAATSWRSILEGQDEGKEVILSEYVNNDRVLKGKCIRTERYKLATWGNSGGELYDLQEDPQEQHNLYSDPGYASLREEMKDILLEKLTESEMPPYTQWLEQLPEHVRNQ